MLHYLWNDSSGNNYGQYYSQRVNVSLQSLDNKVSLPISSQDLLHQYEGYAAISATGDVLFSWTYGKSNIESYIQVSSLFKGASSWSNAITLQPVPPSGNVNYQRTSRCAINSVNGVVVWEFRDQANTSISKNDYLARISLNNGSITSQLELLIPGSLSTPYSYIDRPGNIVVTFNANNTNYSACLLESGSLTFNPSISLGNITPKGGEPAKIAFTNGSIHHGLMIFEDTTKNNTYSSICKLFSTANGLIYIFNQSSPISYQKEP